MCVHVFVCACVCVFCVFPRLSASVRSPEGKVSLYCKGADSVIFERLNPSCRKLMEVTTEHLNVSLGRTSQLL